jgi:hypothetical protein
MVVETRLAELAKENNKLKIELDSILKTTPATDTQLHSGGSMTPSTGDVMPPTTLHHPQALMPSAQYGGLSAMMAHSPNVINAQQAVQPQMNNMAPLLQQLYSQAQFAINQMNNVNRLGLLSTCLSAAATPTQQHSIVHDRRLSPSLSNQQLTPPALCAVDLASNSSRGSTYSASAVQPPYTGATSRSCDLRVLANAPLLGSLLQNQQQQQQSSPNLLSSTIQQQQQALKNCLSSFAVHLDQNGRRDRNDYRTIHITIHLPASTSQSSNGKQTNLSSNDSHTSEQSVMMISPATSHEGVDSSSGACVCPQHAHLLLYKVQMTNDIVRTRRRIHRLARPACTS